MTPATSSMARAASCPTTAAATPMANTTRYAALGACSLPLDDISGQSLSGGDSQAGLVAELERRGMSFHGVLHRESFYQKNPIMQLLGEGDLGVKHRRELVEVGWRKG